MRETLFWQTPVKFWEVADGSLSPQDEFKYRQEAREEMQKFIDANLPGFRMDLSTFEFELVTRFKSGRIVPLVLETGPRPRFTPARTDGMLHYEAASERLRSIDSAMAFVAKRAAEGFKPLPEEDYPEEILFRSTVNANKYLQMEVPVATFHS